MGTPGVVLLISSGILGKDGQLRFEQSVMGPLRTISSCLTIPKWYSRIEQNPVGHLMAMLDIPQNTSNIRLMMQRTELALQNIYARQQACYYLQKKDATNT